MSRLFTACVVVLLVLVACLFVLTATSIAVEIAGASFTLAKVA